MRIFESQKYQNEELTIFNSSLIEDTITSGKHILSGKYTGSYILIHPEYQKEMESFQKENCPRFHRGDIQLAAVVDDKKSRQKDHSCRKSSQRGSLLWRQQANGDEQLDDWDFEDEPEVCTSSVRNVTMGTNTGMNQAVDNQSSDEWDFKDESNIHVTNIREARRLNSKPADCTNNITCRLLPNPHSKSLSEAVTQSGENPLSNNQQNIMSDVVIKPKVTSLSSAGKDRRRCLVHDSEVNIWDGNYSVNTDSTNQCGNVMEGKRKQFKHSTGTHLQDVEEKESFLDDTCFKSKVTCTSGARATLRSRFLSSMDDGVVHIDDIKLPDIPVDDFIPNHDGCRVDSK